MKRSEFLAFLATPFLAFLPKTVEQNPRTHKKEPIYFRGVEIIPDDDPRRRGERITFPLEYKT